MLACRGCAASASKPSWSMRWPSSTICPLAMRPGGSSRPMMDGAGQRLAGTRLAHHAEDFTGRDVEGNVVDGAQGAAPMREIQRRDCWTWSRLIGSAQARVEGIAQPVAEQVDATARSTPALAPGNTVIHHSPENKILVADCGSACRAKAMSAARRHRETTSVASVMMAVATWMVASTITGPMTLGSTCLAHDAQ